MDKLKEFFAKRLQYEPETADQKAVIRELASVQQHVDAIGHVDEDTKNERQYDAFLEHADDEEHQASRSSSRSSHSIVVDEKRKTSQLRKIVTSLR